MKIYFLPIQSAKKDRQSLPFFGVKATKPQGRAGFALGFNGLKAELALPSNPNHTGKK
ncbi:MAG: hypothetical protein LBC37_04790 [Zoogloeaceae bacterium]|nr:hypothetical protein [Zoogloeaceae bacterium]